MISQRDDRILRHRGRAAIDHHVVMVTAGDKPLSTEAVEIYALGMLDGVVEVFRAYLGDEVAANALTGALDRLTRAQKALGA